MKNFGCDLGQSSLKFVGADGSLQFASTAALFAGDVSDYGGGKKRKRPLVVEGEFGKLWVGQRAHSYGMPVENLDFDKLAGSDAMQGVFYGAMSEYMRQFGTLSDPLRLIVGMPLQMLQGNDANVAKWKKSVIGWLSGSHAWVADGDQYVLSVEDVRLYPQALGAPVDYAMGMDGTPVSAERQAALVNECATISIGSNTVELLVTKGNEKTHKFNAGKPVGVRQLWRRVDPAQEYTFGEFDELLRSGSLPEDMNVTPHLNSWSDEILGFVNSIWGQSYHRFHKVFLVGGGAILLERHLRAKFNGKSLLVDEPVMAIARGLYKLGFGIK